MARPTVWRRLQVPGLTALHTQSNIIASLAPGETLTRTRLHMDVYSASANLYVWAAIPILWGVCVVSKSPGTPLDLFADPNNAEWVWWEGLSLRNQVAEGVGTAKYIDAGPPGSGDRDIRAQRKADPVHGSYVIHVLTGSPLVPTQLLSLGLTSSCLVTLP